MNTWVALAILVAPATAVLVGNITKCQTGKTDLVGTDTTVFTVQVCNLFGTTCYMNHPETASSDCATKALQVDNLQCALFPIMSYENNARTDASKLLVGGSAGCSVSCSGTDCKFSGGCVSVQCSLGGTPVTYAGPAMTITGSGTSNARYIGVTNTAATGAFGVNDFASLTVSGSKTVLLTRTGNYVGTYSRGGSASGTNTYNFGKLPTLIGNNYGPKACPSATSLLSAATGTSKEELRMCGNTGKWVYFGAANLLMDKSMYAELGADTSGLATFKRVIGSIPFLSGNSAYRSGMQMDDARAVYLHDGATTAAALLMTSETISPAMSTSTAMGTQDFAGQWRFYSVVFYCDSYARTDLTLCPAANRKMFYVADPNPAPAFGTTAQYSGSGGGTTGSLTTGATHVVAGLGALITSALIQL